MDPDAELMKHLTVLMDRAKASVRRSTVPLFTADKDRTVRLPLGSAVLLSVADVDFLVSAAHVTDTQFRDGEVVGIGGAITGDDRIVPLEWTSLLSSPLPATGVRQHDMVDVSVVRLPASLSAHLRGTGRQFLRLMDLAKLGDIGSQPQFLLAGYPGVLTSEEPNQETVRSTLFAHGLAQQYLDSRSLPDFDATKEIAVEYDRRRVVYPPGDARIAGPIPGGMSGSGVWWMNIDVRRLGNWTADRLRLVAIVHTAWPPDETTPRALRATRIDVVVEAMARVMPEL